MAAHPSGEQYEIRNGGTVAVVTEVGGALRDLRVDGRPLLDGYDVAEKCTGARGQSLLPWPNRIRNGRYGWAGQEQQLAITEPDKNCAIHGLARWANWDLAKQADDSIVMSYRLHPQIGWEWTVDLLLEYVVDEAGVTVRTTATNLSDSAAPFAAGAHPYLNVGLDHIDGATLHLPVGTYLPTDEQQIPTGVDPVDGTPYDFRQPRQLGDTHIDYAFADLERAADGTFRATLAGEWTTEFWMDATYRYVEVFTGDTLPTPDKRRTGLGMEPMTGPPNAFASGIDVIRLEPAQTWTGAWGIRLAG